MAEMTDEQKEERYKEILRESEVLKRGKNTLRLVDYDDDFMRKQALEDWEILKWKSES